MNQGYRNWLEAQKYEQRTISTQMSNASRIESAYGDLDALYDTDELRGVLSSLEYSVGDARHNRPNPSKIVIGGDLYNNLASFRSAVQRYIRFREASSDHIAAASTQPLAAIDDASDGARERIGLERDLQASLRRSIDQLEAGLSIIDDGAERSVASGFIDITARDRDGTVVVVELKAGVAGRSAVGQILSYMGDIQDEHPGEAVRGILVAAEFDGKARSAARMVPKLQLQIYAVRFSFIEAS